MLFEKQNGTFDGGSLDVICILQDINTNRFHAAFFEEHPMPGEIKPIDELTFVRLKSKMHHTGGADTYEGALIHLEELTNKITVPEKNIWKEPVEWDGELGIVWIVPKW